MSYDNKLPYAQSDYEKQYFKGKGQFILELLKKYEHMSRIELAAEMGLSVNTVEKSLKTIRDKIKTVGRGKEAYYILL